MDLKRIILLVLAFTFMCSSAYAYSLDDIKNDYPALEIKYIDNKNGTTTRYIDLHKISYSEGYDNPFGVNQIIFSLEEYPNNTKALQIAFYYLGVERIFFNKVTLGTETDSYDFYPSTPLKTKPVKTAFLEQMCIFVYNDQDFNKWENAKLIQIMGETKQFCISTGTIDYAVCMNTIRRFLFE